MTFLGNQKVISAEKVVAQVLSLQQESGNFLLPFLWFKLMY
jgi:hypothetical protein